jgi:hypothetical protein
MPDRGVRRHRGWFWAAVLAALIAFVGGGAFAYVTYAATAGPDGAVKGYFAALARGNAPAALGFGDLPPGPHELLTSTVLRAQRKLAPIRHVRIVATQQSGDIAKVTVEYDLDFADSTQHVSDDIAVRRQKGSWRLERTAATTELQLRQARDRATILGGPVPDGTVLVFPGALPITFDTPYLRLAPSARSVDLSAHDATDLSVQVTAAGRRATQAAVVAALRNCLTGGARPDPRCPVPSSRTVPGTVRASVRAADVRAITSLKLAATSRGLVTITGQLRVRAHYTALDFENQPVARTGVVTLPLRATAYATAPTTITWTEEDR